MRSIAQEDPTVEVPVVVLPVDVEVALVVVPVQVGHAAAREK